MTTVNGSIIVYQTKSGDQLSFRFETTKALWQGYNDETQAVAPDWTQAANQPVITPKAYSARLGFDVAKTGAGTWTYNGLVLTFDATTGISTNSNASFKINFSNYALTIVKNLASSTNMNGDILTYSGNWDNGYAESAGGQIEISIDKIGSTPYSGIVNLTTNTLNETNGVTSLTVSAVLLRGTTVLSSGFTVVWKKLDGTILSTSLTQVINRSMVSGKEIFYCEFYVDGILQSVYYFSIYDMSDPAQISFELKTAYDKTDAGKDVQYYVKLLKSGDGSQIISAAFTAVFLNSRRRTIAGGTSSIVTTSGTGTLTVTYADGNLIDATDSLKNGTIEAVITANY